MNKFLSGPKAISPFTNEVKRESSYFEFYNACRPHSSLGGQTPDTAYFENDKRKKAA